MDDRATRVAARLLGMLGVETVRPIGGADHPALAWRRAGLMAVTGRADGPALVCPASLATEADAVLLALRALAPDPETLPSSGALLLGERARLRGLERQGNLSANGTCRLVDTADGRIALNLARDEDRDLVPILLGVETIDGWNDIARAAAGLSTADLMALGIELGLPIAQDGLIATPDSPFVIEAGTAGVPSARPPLVLDFASLWAGPLAGALLAMLGADVVKVESLTRPDGARRGHGGFYDLLNGAKRSVAIDFADPAQLARLQALVERADIVIEGSRPRALRRLGIDRSRVVARGGIWLSITGHDDPDRVGFGDDAAIAGGLATHMARGWGEPLFAGDAIADPLTGLHAALAGWALWQRREGALVQMSLARTVAYACALDGAQGQELRHWQAVAEADATPLYPLRPVPRTARAMGADNAQLL